MSISTYPVTIKNHHFALSVDKAVLLSRFLEGSVGSRQFDELPEDVQLLVATRGLPNMAVAHPITQSAQTYEFWFSLYSQKEREMVFPWLPKLFNMAASYNVFLHSV